MALIPSPDGGYPFGNTAEGEDSLFNITPTSEENGGRNTAVGFNALYDSITGFSNTGVGWSVLKANLSVFNTAIGSAALSQNVSGFQNTAVGAGALEVSTGNQNTAVGLNALNTLTSGNSNIAIGESAGQSILSGSNNITIGNTGVSGDNNTIRIGNSTHSAVFIANIDILPKLVPVGTILRIPFTSPTPVGYTLFGTETVKYTDTSGHPSSLTVNLWQKN